MIWKILSMNGIKTLFTATPMALTEHLIVWVTNLIDTLGYTGITVLMILESMIAPVPSEAVMPFAGSLILTGRFTWAGVLVTSTVGSIIGSLISYYMGLYGGRPLVLRVGKWFLLNEHHLDLTAKFFERKGEWTIFVSRFIPVVRHLISIPAGMGKMRLAPFLIYTTIGAFLWNLILTVVGYQLGRNWQRLDQYTHWLDYVMVLAIIVAAAYFVWSELQRRRRKKSAQ